MSHVYPGVNESTLREYARIAIDEIETDLFRKLDDTDEADHERIKVESVIRAYQLFRLLDYFNLSLHPDFSIRLSKIMANLLIY